jgi:hypothetical protein
MMFDNLLMVALGILSVLMGYGKVAVSKNASKNEEYLKKYGTLLRVCGIILISAGVLLVTSHLFFR